jgi:2-hydroxychromene-2-carboxylate isomerase
MEIQFWFEFASTYSYPAALRVEPLCRERSVNLVWKPFLLGPTFAAQGWTDSPFNLYPAKGRYMWRDVERLCARHGFDFRRPSAFPRNGLLAARVACLGAGEPWLPEFVRSVFRANFAEDLDIAEPETVRSILLGLDGLGEPGDALLRRAQSSETKARLRRQVDEASTLGVFGAPSFIVNGELFWGNDRLEEALSWAEGARLLT